MLLRMTMPPPQFSKKECLNNPGGAGVCTRCQHICPAGAISLETRKMPELDASACTRCMACVRACPTDAIGHQTMQPAELLREAHDLVMQGQTGINVSCDAVADTHSGLNIPCHAAWDPMLLACMAAEGVRTLHLGGIQQCDSCPVRHGEKIMRQTEKDYATLNNALGIRLTISWQEKVCAAEKRSSVAEPERRAFFRKLIPSITQSAAVAAAHIGQATQAAREETHQGSISSSELPIRLRLFLRALPRLQVNFTPIPHMSTLPLGAIHADASCTACNRCVERCPTKALDIREFGDNKILEFRPDACIGCQHCIDVCPEHALGSLPGISLHAVSARHTRPLVMVSSNEVKDCS